MSEPEREEYIGDGVYVSHDGWHYCLRAPGVPGGESIIYLEEPALRNLESFVQRTRLWIEMDKTEAEKADTRKREAQEGFDD